MPENRKDHLPGVSHDRGHLDHRVSKLEVEAKEIAEQEAFQGPIISGDVGKAISVGDRVEWRWGATQIETGVVREISMVKHHGKRTLQGDQVDFSGTTEDPAYLIQPDKTSGGAFEIVKRRSQLILKET